MRENVQAEATASDQWLEGSEAVLSVQRSSENGDVVPVHNAFLRIMHLLWYQLHCTFRLVEITYNVFSLHTVTM